MDNNFNKSWQSSADLNKEDIEKPLPPPPPPPEITLRTMKSDLDSLKQSGGENVTPQSFTPPELKKEILIQPPPSPEKPEAKKVELTDFSKTEDVSKTDVSSQLSSESKNRSKTVLVIIGILIGVIAIAAVVYFVIYPNFFPLNNLLENVPGVSTPPVSEEAASQREESAALPLPQGEGHQSFFTIPADLGATVQLSGLTLNSWRQAINIEADNKPSGDNILKEIVLSVNGSQPSFSYFLPVIFEDFSSGELSQFFAEDFTTFLFYDKNGVWPGFIAKLKEGADLTKAKILISKLEDSSTLINLYLTSVGAPSSAGFKTGNYNARYITFPDSSAALDYAWANNYLVISASYSGFKVALAKLGL